MAASREPRALLSRAMLVVVMALPSMLLPAEAMTADDPLEPVNRIVFSANRELDRFALRPVTIVYRTAVPAPVRRGARHFLNNVLEPANAINAALQGDLDAVDTALSRFVLNSVVGLGGVLDVAAHAGIDRDPRTFGSTLASWGLGPGSYLMLPVLGPSTTREAFGRGIDSIAAPHNQLIQTSDQRSNLQFAEAGLRAVMFRDRNFEQLDAGYANTLDAYATVRATYLQVLFLRDTPDASAFDEGGLDFDEFDE